MKDITEEKPIKKDDKLGIFDQWKANPTDGKYISEFLKSVEPTISSALRSYAPGQETSLRTRANIMTLDIANRYKPDKKTHINTFLMNGLKSLQREAHKRQQPIHIPENVSLEQNRLINASKDVMAKKGRPGTVHELADMSGMSVKRIEKVRKYKNPVSSSTLLSEKGDSLFNQQKDPQDVWAEYVYHDLNPIDKKVYEWSTGYGGSKLMSKSDIAKHLKISAPAVSQRVSRIIKKLEEGSSFGH